jgi:hypothetical protein
MLKNLFISTILIIATISVPVYSENSSSSSTQSSSESSQSSLSSQSSSDNSSSVSSNQSSSQSVSSISNEELLAQTESEEQKETLKVDLKAVSSQKRQLLVQLKTPKTNKDLENLLLKETPTKPLPIRASSNEEITSPSNLLLVQAKPEENLTDLANKIKDLPEVESVQTNNPYQFDSLTPTNNPNYTSDQWYLKDSNTNPMGTYTQSAWQTVATALGSSNSGGSSSVKIAVIDSGVNTGLADFAGVNIANSSRFFSKTTSCNPLVGEQFLAIVFETNNYICRKDGPQFDEVGHGTAVAGVIFMQDNSLNGIGVAHKTTLMPIALHSGAFNTFGVAKTIRYAVDNGAKVINLSLGTPYNDLPVKAEIDYAVSQGVSVVASSGNCGNKTAIQCYPFLTPADPEYYVGTNVVSYPAAYPSVIAVGAINPDGTKSNYSTAGSYVDLVAPVGQTGVSGGAAYSICGVVTVAGPCFGKTQGDGSFWTGTSFAAPEVAGAIGLLRSTEPTLTQLEVQSRIKASTDKTTLASGNGIGSLNVCKAVKGCGWVEYPVTHYFTWYDTMGGNYTWTLISNPNNKMVRVRLKIGNSIDEVYSVAPGGVITPYFLGYLTGPVLISTELDELTSQPFKIIVTQRVRFLANGFYSFNEYAGIPAASLTNKYYFTWNDTTNGNSAWTLVYNPSTTLSANVEIKIGGVVKATKTLTPGEIWTPLINNLLDGPVIVSSDQNIISSQRVLFNKSGKISFNEFPGISETNMSSKYYFTWNDTTNGNSAWTLIGNPNDTPVDIKLTIGNSFSQNYTINPNSNITPLIPNVQNGAIIVESLTSGKNIYATQRVLYLNTFNEFPGISETNMSSKYYFTWNDTTNNNYACTLIYNPSTTLSANVEIKIGGVVKATKTLTPGEIWTPVINNLVSGPVEVNSNIDVVSTQRVIFGQSFNEFSGII